MDIVYFDLETQRTANDVGGWDKKERMGMSIGVTYSTGEGCYEIFNESRVEALIERLRRADLVVGFNTINFDYKVLQGYACFDVAEMLRSLDLLVEIEKVAGHRMRLEDIAQATLGIGKIAEGLDAIRWWREGRLLDIAEYCCVDVKVTRLVHEFGCQNGEIFYNDRVGRRQRLAIDWKP